MLDWKVEESQAFRNVLLHPILQPGGGFLVLANDKGQMSFGSCAVRDVENRSDVSSYLAHHGLARHIRTGIVLQLILAALPGNPTEHSSRGSLQSRKIIAELRQTLESGQAFRFSDSDP